MVVRPTDENGDMMPIQSGNQMLTGTKAVAQIARDRLLFYRGEWWEDESLGIRIPDFLANSIRASDVNLFARYITSYLAETEGVRGISSVSAEYDKRSLIFRAILVTDEGSEPLEVNMSGIL